MKLQALYNFQINAIEWASSKFKINKWVLIHAPTGCGKTRIGLVTLANVMKASNEDGTYLVYSIIAKDQAEKELDVLVSQGQISKEIRSRIIVKCYQSLNCNEKGIVVADEAHHIHTTTYYFYYLRNSSDIRFLIGLTGTPRGTFIEDGFESLYQIDRRNIYEIKFPTLKLRIDFLNKKDLLYFEKVRFTKDQKAFASSVPSGVKILNFLNDKSSADRKRKMRYIASVIARGKSYLGKGIIFTKTNEYADELAIELEALGLNVRSVHSNLVGGLKTVNHILQSFRAGVLDYVVGVNMLNEAYDEPSIQSVILTEQTGSDIRYSQWIGRGYRKFDGKSCFYLLDFRDNYDNYHKKIIENQLFVGSKSSGVTSIYSNYKDVQSYRSDPRLYQLRELINDQLDYFGLKTNKAITEKQVRDFLFMFIYQNPYFADTSERYNKLIENLLSMDLSLEVPSEVQLVREVISPIINYRLGVPAELELTFEDKTRIDLFIAQNPATIIEFGMGEVRGKYEQIMGYHEKIRSLMYQRDFSNLIIGMSFDGDRTSRVIDEKNKVEFINWLDFFSFIISDEMYDSISDVA